MRPMSFLYVYILTLFIYMAVHYQPTIAAHCWAHPTTPMSTYSLGVIRAFK